MIENALRSLPLTIGLRAIPQDVDLRGRTIEEYITYVINQPERKIH